MNHAGLVLDAANHIYARNSTSSDDAATETRPGFYKIVGLSLAIASGLFIGCSFVLKKVGLLKANEKYNEVAGDGYGYLKNAYWWSGMTLMIIGEICNFVAYAFTDAILVTPLGALSVVITTILSAIFLKERLSMVGKVACFLCIVGSVVIVMNAPEESSVSDIQEMQSFVIKPGFLSYTGVILIGSVITAFYAGPRWGKKNMFVYISICSWVGGLSVVATQGLGSAIVAQAGGTKQYDQWFLYVLFVFVVCTLLTEIIFLNKALNLFNAALVTPTYYVYFTSTTIITSAVLFRGFKGTASSIVTVVNGFLTICSGVVLLQLSKSAKDVPDSAVFAGDLDQIQTIAEQEQSETEPKADAIRGTAAIVRRISTARQNMEIAELKRLHEERMREHLEAVSEDGHPQPQYEWDGIRRRRTTLSSVRSRSHTVTSTRTFTPPPPTPHPPLGWSHLPTDEELANDRPDSAGIFASFAGTIRRPRGASNLGRQDSVLTDTSSLPTHEHHTSNMVQSPMHPMQLTEIAVPSHHGAGNNNGAYYGGAHAYGLPLGSKTAYLGAAGEIPEGASDYAASDAASLPPDPPPHATRRQFSFQNVFRRHQPPHAVTASPPPDVGIHEADHTLHPNRPPSARGYAVPKAKNATEEERLGLVKSGKRDSQHGPMTVRGSALPVFAEEEDDYDRYGAPAYADEPFGDEQKVRYGRGITGTSPPAAEHRRGGGDSEKGYEPSRNESISSTDYGARGRRRNDSNASTGGYYGRPRRNTQPQPPPPGGGGAFI